jgi:signal transduction histidine kinase
MEPKTLHVLIVEDSVDDAELILGALRTDYLDVDCLRVETAEAMQNALGDGNWDVVLSDYNLPGFSANEALSVLKGSGLDIPFIIVSGCIGEEVAVALMKAGAHDFVVKGSARLVPAVQRALMEADTRRQFNLAQIALQHSEARFRAIASNLPGMVYQFTRQRDGSVLFPYVSDGSLALLDLDPQALRDHPELFLYLILPEDQASYEQSMAVSVINLSTWNWEGRIKNDDAQGIKWISLRASPRVASQGAVIWDGIMTNITRNKLAEIEIKRSHEQLAEFSSYLQKIKEQERAKIAREIHDDIGGTLTAIKCDILWCTSDTPRDPRYCREKAASIESLVDSVIDSTRRISMDLRPGILDCGIVAALRWQAKEFSGRTAIPCEIFCDHEEIPLDPDLSVAVFRIFQETLTNIAKHANASKIKVRFDEIDGWLELNIADNGRGITDDDMAKPKSFGIRGIQERCQYLGGNLEITGTPGEGTWVNIRMPVHGGEDRPLGQTTAGMPHLTDQRAAGDRFQEFGKRVKNAATEGKAR